MLWSPLFYIRHGCQIPSMLLLMQPSIGEWKNAASGDFASEIRKGVGHKQNPNDENSQTELGDRIDNSFVKVPSGQTNPALRSFPTPS